MQIRQGVVEFMPYSFALVNKASARFKEVERRFNYTTPKTFLELIKLYKNVLAKKREKTTVSIDRLETGLTKLHKTQKDVDVLVEAAKRMAVQVQEKVVSADAFAEKVGEEKVKVNAENEAAQVEKAKCEKIAEEVTQKQASCEKDLAAALPLVQQARAHCMLLTLPACRADRQPALRPDRRPQALL
jgi:dynein heavy chain, axonemal